MTVSGICGLVLSEQNRQLSPGDLAPMLRPVDVALPGKDFSTCLGSVAMGARSFPGRLSGGAMLAGQARPLLLVFHGTLCNLKDVVPAESVQHNPLDGILDLYATNGVGFLQRLRGDFALAIWDGRDDTLYLATDRFRVQPLFYYHDSNRIVFASRVESILACPLPVDRSINPEAIVDVIASSVISAPKTVYQSIKKLQAGHLLVHRNGRTRETPYWEPTFLSPSRDSETALAHTLRSRMDEAILDRLSVDTSRSIGAFLSGGVDSSTVTALLTRFHTPPVKTFSIGFAEGKFNEIEYARITARAFATDQHEYFVSPRDTIDALPTLIQAFDEPYGNASAIPCYFCAKMARERGVDVLYAGDGGDELFAGNERYATQQYFDRYSHLPAWLREPLLRPLVFASAQAMPVSIFLKAKKYILRASIPYAQRISSYDLFRVVPLKNFLSADVLKSIAKEYDPYESIASYFSQARAATNLDRHLFLDWKITLADNDLIKVMRATEAAGISVRFPFLDERLVDFSLTVPAHLKMRGSQLRAFFKNAYREILPVETLQKKKHGFGLPIPVWLRTDPNLNELMHELVLSPRTIQRGYFKKSALQALVERHRTDETSFYGTALWNLMVLELWHRHFVDAPPHGSGIPPNRPRVVK